MGYDSDHPFSEGEVGKCGVAIDSLEDMEILFDGIDLEKTTVSMTINSPASILWAMYLAVAEKQGRRLEQDLRHDAERHPEGIHRAEGIHLSAGAVDAAGNRYLRVRLEVHAEVQHDFDQRLSHSRSRLDGAAGVGLHHLRRRRVRGMGAPPRPRCRRVRSASQLLLQRAQRFLRGDREVSRGPQDLVPPDEGPLRREEPALLADCASTLRRRVSRSPRSSR